MSNVQGMRVRHDLRRVGWSLQAVGGLVLRGAQAVRVVNDLRWCVGAVRAPEDLAAASRGLVKRWSAHYRDTRDGLVHFADDHYCVAFIGGHPDAAFTRCGRVVTWNGIRAGAGTYVALEVPLTCVRCAGGAHDGRTRRNELKSAMFAEMYGRPAGMILGEYAAADVALSIARLSRRSVLRRCTRLAQVLYLKATEYSRA